MDKRLDLSRTDKESRPQVAKARKELFGSTDYEGMPFELYETMLLVNNRVDIETYKKLESQEQGKILAAVSIKNNMDTLERFYSMLERNRKSERKN